MLDATATEVRLTPQPDSRCDCNSPRWTAVTTHPQAERWAASNLTRRGYRCYLPLCVVLRRDRVTPTIRHPIEVPVFTGYLFVTHTPGASWRPIYETPGVRSMLRHRDQLQYVPDAALAALQAGEALRRSAPAENAQWAPGVPCSLAVGPFAQHPAVVTAVHGSTATVSLMMLGHLRDMAVPLSSLRMRDE